MIVSVIIPVYNAQNTLEECLDSIVNQHFPTKEFEVIAVDNNSTDKSMDIINSYAQVTSVFCGKSGPAAARNAGIHQASGELLLLTDADCVADPLWIQNFVDSYREFKNSKSEVLMIGGGIRGRNKNIWALLDDFCCWNQFHPKLKPRDIPVYFPSANICIPRDYITKIGGFNEELRYSEDYALCQEVIKDGYKIYFQPKASVNHINRIGFKEVLFHAVEWTSSHLQKLKMGIISPVKCGLLYYGLGTFFLVLRILYFCLKAGRFHSILFTPLIFLNQFLKSLSLLKTDHQYQKEERKKKKNKQHLHVCPVSKNYTTTI